ncbi:ArsR/SmtB family transcription factor [Paenibacillus allorhizosphaerae]|nr:helix-turn-helix domain-containing protein [Paenibacillus allorhizosphaerae]
MQGNLKRIPATRVQETAKALSGDVRLRILEVLGKKPMSISQLMDELGVAQPTVSINVQILEQAGLLETAQGANREKICSRSCDTVLFELPMLPGEALDHLEEIQMPVGMYSDFRIQPPCGLLGKEGMIGCYDDPRSFYLPDRSDALMLWFSESGYVEYRFPNPVPPGVKLTALCLSAELCSEAVGFQHDWPSDITLSVNGVEIGTWTSPGDFGEPKGIITPSWWIGNTQYGLLTEWRIEETGSLLNGTRCSDACLDHLDLHFDRPITVRFEVKEDAVNKRGLNLMGAHFGNHAQAVKLTFIR